MESKPASDGIEALIARLHGEGIDAGRREAERIVCEARGAAAEIVARARAEADALRAAAQAAAQAEREAAVHALALARRDALLALKEELCAQLAGRLRRLAAEALADPAVLRQVLLAAVGAERAASVDDVDRLLAGATAAMLGDGIALAPGPTGVRIRLAGDDAVVEISEESLGELLQAYVMPRFRARLDAASRA